MAEDLHAPDGLHAWVPELGQIIHAPENAEPLLINDEALLISYADSVQNSGQHLEPLDQTISIVGSCQVGGDPVAVAAHQTPAAE